MESAGAALEAQNQLINKLPEMVGGQKFYGYERIFGIMAPAVNYIIHSACPSKYSFLLMNSCNFLCFSECKNVLQNIINITISS